MEITIQCFGLFRSFGEQIKLSIAEGDRISDMRKALLDKLQQMDASFNKLDLLGSARFASETEILQESMPLKEGMAIAIIPPVSGG